MPDSFDPHKIEKRLASLASVLPGERPDMGSSSARTVSRLRALVLDVSERLRMLGRWLDPIAQPDELFDPNNPNHAAELIAARLEGRSRHALNALTPFYGSGVYALYYNGDHPAYRFIAGTEIPIYVGKAEPANSRAETPEEQGTKLYDRLVKDHLRSISAAERYARANAATIPALDVADFECRFLPLASAYAGAVESSLIRRYEPVWNTVCPGFGKHGDSPSTRANTRSEWDTLHPGRSWALRPGNVPNPKSVDDIAKDIREHSKRVREMLVLLSPDNRA